MYRHLLIAAPCLALLTACTATPFMGEGISSNLYSDTLGNPSIAFNNDMVLKATEASAAQVNIDWAAVIVSYISTYMTVFINTVYFHISKLLLLVVFFKVSNL